VAFSHSGQTAAVVEAARQARQNGACLIAFTNRPDSPLGRESDVALCTHLDSSPCPGKNAAARLVQLSLLEALFGAVAQKDCAAAEANLGRTAAATRGPERFLRRGDAKGVLPLQTKGNEALETPGRRKGDA